MKETMKYKKELKTLFAMLPNIGAFYISWYVWQAIKYLFFRLCDWATNQTDERTIKQITTLEQHQITFSLSLVSTGLLWLIFGQESLLNVCTYVIGSYLYHGTMIFINL